MMSNPSNLRPAEPDYFVVRTRLLASLYERVPRMSNANLARLNQSLAAQGFQDNAESAATDRAGTP